MKSLIKHTAMWTCSAAALVAVLAAPSTARADHESFKYEGIRHGFHGEALIITALDALEEAYTARHPRREARAARSALYSVRRALDEVCVPSARYYLRGAADHLHDFLYRHQLRDLDDAAALLNKALVVEQSRHAPRRHWRGHRPHRYERFPRRSGYWGGSGLYLGGRRGGLVIGF